MKSTLLALVVLFASLFTYGQAAKPAPTPAPPAQTTPVQPAPQEAQPIFEAGGLDNLCQAGLNGHYNFDGGAFGTNNPAESQALSNASTCIGYINGWEHAISGAFITEDNKLWYVEISDQFNVTAAAVALHEFLVKNPDARTVPSPLVLLSIAVSQKTAQVSPVDIRNVQPNQPQNEENVEPPVLKSTT
jgi:hypothetical protein